MRCEDLRDGLRFGMSPTSSSSISYSDSGAVLGISSGVPTSCGIVRASRVTTNYCDNIFSGSDRDFYVELS